MTLSAQQLANLAAPTIAEQTRVFSGPTYKALAAAGFTLSLSGWTAPDTGKPTGWTEISSRTSYKSALRYRLNGNSAGWEATLSGSDYDGALLGIGRAVMVWKRIWTPAPNLIANGDFASYTGTLDDANADTFAGWVDYGVNARAVTGRTAGGVAVALTGNWSVFYYPSWVSGTSGPWQLTLWHKGGTAVWAVGNYVNGTLPAAAEWTRYTTIVSSADSGYMALYPLGTEVFVANLHLGVVDSWQPWQKHYVGQIVASDDGDDYRHGQPWQRTVRGLDSLVERYNAPRLTAGAIDITRGATVTVQGSDTLSDPALEAGSGEYVGAASVVPGNIVDGKPQTVWISQSTPGDNLLTNGSFEQYTGTPDDGTSDTITGWINNPTAVGDKVEAVTATKHHDAAAVKLTAVAGTGGISMCQKVAVNAGQRYRFSVWTQGDGVADGNIEIFGGSSSAPDWASSVVNEQTGHASASWGQYQKDFLAPAGKTHLWVFLAATTGHYAYFDDAQLRDDGGFTWLDADGYVRVSEVFFRPVAGVPLSQGWWVEVQSCRNRNEDQEFELIAGSGYQYTGDPGTGNYTTFKIARGWKEKVKDGRFGIVCANRAMFERITGGAPAAQFVIDASDYAPDFTLDPTDGFVGVRTKDGRSTIIWSPGGAVRHADYEGVGYWYGSGGENATFDSAQTPEYSGYSIRRDLAVITNDVPDGFAPCFFRNTFPSPGAYADNTGAVVLKIKLPDNVCLLAQGVNGSSQTIQLDNYLGWLPSGKGLFEGGDIFSYTGKSASGLTGVTWDSGGDHTHVKDEQVFPYAKVYLQGVDDWAEHTGYPVETVKLFRRKTPYLERFTLYCSHMADARDYQASGWRADYADNAITVAGVNSGEHALALYDPYHATGYTWVQTFLLVIEHMSDGGRAKLNEFVAKINQIAIGNDGLPVISTARSFDLASYLLQTYLGMHGGDIVDESVQSDHRLGSYSLAITALSAVLDDLARKTGCIVIYGTDGVIRWAIDPWWPLKGIKASELAQSLAAGDVRGALRWTDTAATIDAVIVNALVAEGSEPRAVRCVFPPPQPPNTEPILGAQVAEINDVVVANESDARLVAEREFKRLTTNGQLEATMTGILQGVRPGDVLALAWDYDGSGSATRYWQVIGLQGERLLDNGKPSIKDTVTARLYLE